MFDALSKGFRAAKNRHGDHDIVLPMPLGQGILGKTNDPASVAQNQVERKPEMLQATLIMFKVPLTG